MAQALRMKGILVSEVEYEKLSRSRLSGFSEQSITDLLHGGREAFMEEICRERLEHIHTYCDHPPQIQCNPDGSFSATGTRESIAELFSMIEGRHWGVFSKQEKEKPFRLPISNRFGNRFSF